MSIEQLPKGCKEVAWGIDQLLSFKLAKKHPLLKKIFSFPNPPVISAQEMNDLWLPREQSAVNLLRRIAGSAAGELFASLEQMSQMNALLDQVGSENGITYRQELLRAMLAWQNDELVITSKARLNGKAVRGAPFIRGGYFNLRMEMPFVEGRRLLEVSFVGAEVNTEHNLLTTFITDQRVEVSTHMVIEVVNALTAANRLMDRLKGGQPPKQLKLKYAVVNQAELRQAIDWINKRV